MSGIRRNLGIARIDFVALERLLQLPEGQRVLSAYCSAGIEGIEIRIEGDGMPLVLLGERIPQVQLTIKTGGAE